MSDKARLVVVLAVLLLSIAAFGQGSDGRGIVAPTVLVNVGKPNVWTLEQAHYLLERNRAHDLGLAAAELGPLDANEIVGYRIDALKSLLSAQVQFDQAAGVKNSRALQQYNTDIARYNRLRDQQDQVRTRQAVLAGQLAAAQYTLTQLNEAKADAAKIALQQAEVTRLTSEKAAVDAEATSLATAVGSQPPLNLASTMPTDTGPASILGSNPTFDKLVSSIPGGLSQSKIQASIKLDNYINLQYEIVAKQLTLLRDEAGPGKRVIFLELPQSIYATHKLKLYPDFPGLWGSHLAQTWWRIDSVDTAEPDADADIMAPPPNSIELARLRSLCEEKFQPKRAASWEFPCKATSRSLSAAEEPEITKAHQRVEASREALRKSPLTVAPPVTNKEPQAPTGSQETPVSTFKDALSAEVQAVAHWVEKADPTLREAKARRFAQWILHWDFHCYVYPIGEHAFSLQGCDTGAPDQIDTCGFRLGAMGPAPLSCDAYALDLIPRQSALNVAEAQTSSHAYGFAGLFGLLIGWGGRARYERQRDQYEQFAQQEVYASAFGKGERVFGWTFGPLPGTKRLAPGLRTTYAVLVLPEHARKVKLSAVGCGYRRRRVPLDPFLADAREAEDCGAQNQFVVDVPSSREGFTIEGVYYAQVPMGQRTTVELVGSFNLQTGVLINGTPLQKVVSLGQPMLEQVAFKVSDNAGDKGIQGVFELIGTEKLVLSFVMPPTFAGTPTITIVTPSKAAAINHFRIWINNTQDREKALSDDGVPPMFTRAPTIARIAPEYRLVAPRGGGKPVPTELLLQVFGQGFKVGSKPAVLINGENLNVAPSGASDLAPGQYRLVNDGLIQLLVPREKYFPHWHLDYFTFPNDGTLQATGTRDDDGPPLFGACTLAANTDDKGKVTELTITISGRLFTPGYSPVSKDKNLTITSSAMKGPEEWQVQAKPGESLRNAVIVLKGNSAYDSVEVPISECKGFDKHWK